MKRSVEQSGARASVSVEVETMPIPEDGVNAARQQWELLTAEEQDRVFDMLERWDREDEGIEHPQGELSK